MVFRRLVIKNFIFLSLILTTIRAHKFSIESSDNDCKLIVFDDTLNGLIGNQIKEKCLNVSHFLYTGPGVQLIPTDYCLLMPNLTRFEVQNTAATRFLEIFKENECKHLKKLLLFNNKLSELPSAGFRALRTLETLELAQNELENLASDTFVGLAKLSWLGLSYNRIYKLHDDLLKPLISLETLNLAGNNLGVFDLNWLSSNVKLQNLYCNECGLTTISSSKTPLNNLRKLELKLNQLTDISVINGLTGLNRLELSDNVDLMLGGVEFSQFSNLTELFLGNVSLHKYPNYLKTLPPTIITLNLSSNTLRTLDLDHLSHLIKLEDLYVDGNGLKTLDFERVATMFLKLFEISMMNNEFSSELLDTMKESCESKKFTCEF